MSHRPVVRISCTINGVAREFKAPPMRRLIDVLRDDLGLMGTKEGCGEGECGACSILLGGEPVNSCLVPAIQAQGADITTIEGIGSPGLRHAVQQAFLDHGSAQCGICTPGMVITAAWMVEKKLPADEVARTLAGNLCRCTGYSAIIEAVQAAIVAAQGSRG